MPPSVGQTVASSGLTSMRCIIAGLRRASAILVMLGFSFSLCSPVLYSDSESKLPKCCRRDGAHRCSMMDAKDRLAQAPGLGIKSTRAKCPLYPTGKAMPASTKANLPRLMTVSVAPTLSRPTAVEQTEARFRLSFSRSSQKRGPPSLPS